MFGGTLNIATSSPNGHYEAQLHGGAFSAALQILVDGTPPVSRTKIDASTSLAVAPNFDSNTDFEPVT